MRAQIRTTTPASENRARRGPRAIDLLFHCTARPQAGPSRNCFRTPAIALAEMDSAEVEAAFVSQCKKWSCERQWMCVDTRLDDVLHFTQASPRFFGLAGYNPFDIAESMREIERAVAGHGFRGIFVHADSFRLPLTGALMYPLFAKGVELGVPVIAQLVGDPPPVPDLRRLFTDFPELVLVLAPPQPDPQELSAIAAACENAYFALDPPALAHLVDVCTAGESTAGALAREGEIEECAAGALARDFFTTPTFTGRCMWGSNGVPWTVAPPLSLPVLERQGRDSTSAKQHFLHDNAVRVFALDRPLPARTPRSDMQELLAAER